MNWLRSLALVVFVLGSFASLRMASASGPCTADLDGSGEVDAGDIGSLLLWFGPCPGGMICGGDLDGDTEVSAADIGMVLLSFGACAGPKWATVLEWAPDPALIYNGDLRAHIEATHLPWRLRDNGTGIEMVLIPPGTFDMGCSSHSTSGCNSDESPVHQVTLTQPFYLGRTEVTQAQWVAVMGSNPSHFQSPSPEVPSNLVSNRPVEMVAWNDVQPFCTQTGLRLPTEAEWEYAYRAGTVTAFHGWRANPAGTNNAGELESIAWYSANSGGQTRPVGGRAANGFGLFDMAGNVWEWCADVWGHYSSGPETNPTGPSAGSDRVLRGGVWNDGSIDGGYSCRDSYEGHFWYCFADSCRASSRNRRTSHNRGDSQAGFRVARNP